jgi:type VI secretion system protein VasG
VRAIELKPLIGRLNDVCRKALESAAGLTALRTHYNVEIEHLLMGLLDRTDTEFAAILKKWGVDPARVSGELNRALDRMKTGNARAPALSPDIVEMVKNAWLLASVEQGASRVRSGHMLWGLLADDMLARHMREASPALAAIEPDTLKRDYVAICGGALEATQATTQAVGSEAAGTGAGDVRPGGSAALDQFTTDLTAQAKAGKIDPILGRDTEIRQMVDILTRRRQNNPILAGEAGVGKTAVVE